MLKCLYESYSYPVMINTDVLQQTDGTIYR